MTFPEGPARDHAERTLHVLIGSAYMTTQGYAAEAVERSFERALELCSRYEAAPRLFSALNGLWAYNLVRGDAERTPALVVRMREVAESSGSARRLLFAHHAVGATAFYSGRLEEAVPALREATARYERASTEKSEGPAWQRHAGTAPMYLGWCLHHLGRPDEALTWKTRGLELAERLRDVDAHVEAMTYGVALHHDRREPEAVLELSDRIVPLAEEYGLDFWLGVAKAARGWARCHAGDHQGGLGEIDAGLALFYRSGALCPLVYRACYVAEAHLLAGRSKDGLAAIDDAFERTPGRLDRFYDAEAHRLRGEFHVLEGSTDEAEAEFARAERISRAQGARLFELRTAASRVRLRRETAEASEAMKALRAVYDAFEGGLELPDRVEARKLLEGA
jgi:tetratricopeptide (TPR) repeat protein